MPGKQLLAIWSGLLLITASTAFGQQVPPTLDELIAEIIQQEALYTNLRMKWERTHELQSPAQPGVRGITFSRSSGTYTKIGEKIRADIHKENVRLISEKADDPPQKELVSYDWRYLYNGEMTQELLTMQEKGRTMNFGEVGSARLRNNAEIHEPHGTLLGLNHHSGGLSYRLEKLKQDPRCSVTVEGFEEKHNEPCLKIVIREFHSVIPPKVEEPSRVAGSTELWLAIDKNYQEVAVVHYSHDHSLTIPHITGDVQAFREFRKGVYVPELIVTETNDWGIARREQRKVVQYLNTFRITEIDANPDLPEDFFAEIVFPDRISVDVYNEQQERVTKYVHRTEK